MIDTITFRIFDDILVERQHQDAKHDGGQPQDHDDYRWLGFTLEELGEAAQALNDLTYSLGDDVYLEQEIVATAALCVAWLQNRRRRRADFAARQATHSAASSEMDLGVITLGDGETRSVIVEP